MGKKSVNGVRAVHDDDATDAPLDRGQRYVVWVEISLAYATDQTVWRRSRHGYSRSVANRVSIDVGVTDTRVAPSSVNSLTVCRMWSIFAA
jgi:hypothetical protein